MVVPYEDQHRSQMRDIFEASFLSPLDERREAKRIKQCRDSFESLFKNRRNRGYVAKRLYTERVEGVGFVTVKEFGEKTAIQPFMGHLEDTVKFAREALEERKSSISSGNVEYRNINPDAPLPREGEKIGYFHTLAVDPKVRRRGVGMNLISGKLEASKIFGAKVGIVSCTQDSGSENIFEALGFVRAFTYKQEGQEYRYMTKRFTE